MASSKWLDGEFAYSEPHPGLTEYLPAVEYWKVLDQRDELRAACEALIAYRDKVGPLSFQLEKADDFINAMRLAVEKTRAADDT